MDSDRPGVVTDELRGCVCFGRGVFHFVLSMLPSVFQWFLAVIGVDADRPMSLRELKRSWKLNCIRSLSSALLLNWIYYLICNRFDYSIEVLTELNQNFNTSFLVKLTTAYLHNLEKNHDLAITWYEQAADLVHDYPLMYHATRYLMGDQYWLRCDWEKTKEYALAFINGTNSLYMRCTAYFKVGVSNWMLDQKNDINVYFNLSKENIKEHFDHDQNAREWIDKYYENGEKFTPIDECQLMLDNLIMTRESEKSEEVLNKLKLEYENEQEKSFELQCWIQFYEGMILSTQGKSQESIDLLSKLLESENQLKSLPMFFIIPYSTVEIAENYMKLDMKDEALPYYKKGKGYSNYSYEKYLGYRIIRAFESMKDISRPHDDE